MELVRGRARRPPLVILNAAPVQGARTDQAIEAVRATGIEVCPGIIRQRVAFEYAAQVGQSVAEYEPDGKAAAEIAKLYRSIRQQLGMSTRRGAA